MRSVAVLLVAACAQGALPAQNTAISPEPAVAAPATPHGADAGPIPLSLHFSADLTRDGRPEDISIEFLQRDIHRPFNWVLSVRNADGKVIYFDPHDDEGLDEALSEGELADDCGGYEACKRRHYFMLLPAGLDRCLKPAATAFLVGEPEARQMEQVARSELRSRSLDPARIDTAIAEMQALLRKPGHVSLCVPEGPDLVSAPMIWVESAQRFVTYHRP